MTDWSVTPVVDWLLHKGRLLEAPETVVGELCARLRTAGMPLDRVGFFFWTLHPQYFGVAMFWDGEQVKVQRGTRELLRSEAYVNSPAARIEALCKTTHQDVVLSQQVVRAIGAPWPSLGRFELAGIAGPVEVFALPDDEVRPEGRGPTVTSSGGAATG